VSAKNLYETHDRLVSRAEKEERLGQKGQVLWFYGLSGSGKTTLAAALDRELHDAGRITKVLDGDNVRGGLNANLGFTAGDRAENIRRVAEVAKLFAEAGLIVLASFITPTRATRQIVRDIVGEADLTLVYTKASFETCQQRDPKGLYAKVAAGEVPHFTGKDSGFEPPRHEDADKIIDTEKNDLPRSVEHARALIISN